MYNLKLLNVCSLGSSIDTQKAYHDVSIFLYCTVIRIDTYHLSFKFFYRSSDFKLYNKYRSENIIEENSQNRALIVLKHSTKQ